MAETNRKIIRMNDVVEKTGLCKTTLYQKIRNGEFPAPFPIGGARARGFLESVVDEWINECVKGAAAPLTTTLEQPTAPAKLKQLRSAKAKTPDQLDPAETRRLENLRSGNKARRPEKKQAKAATESA
jgi:prophage regulatory protein